MRSSFSRVVVSSLLAFNCTVSSFQHASVTHLPGYSLIPWGRSSYSKISTGGDVGNVRAEATDSEEFDNSDENMEKTWRFVKKPLLSIGGKGATPTHGNSLRQLLLDHEVVKVKVNTRPFGNDLQTAAQTIMDLCIGSGAPKDMEILQVRKFDKVVMFGMPGLSSKIRSGEFPPEPVVWVPGGGSPEDDDTA